MAVWKKILRILIFLIPITFIVCYCFYYAESIADNVNSKGDIIINEVLADNIGGLRDEEGNYPDWIELYNPTDQTIDLEGYAIGNRKNINRAYILPYLQIPAKDYVVLFADNKDYYGKNIHLNFSLSKKGESVYLFDKKGDIIDFVNYPVLKSNISYGKRLFDMDSEGMFAYPTAGADNPDAFLKQNAIADIGEVVYSVKGGSYEEEFYLELTSTNPDALILYTMDGSEPAPSNSMVYTEAIKISSREDDPNRYVTQRCIPDTGVNPDFHNYLYEYGVDNVFKGTVVRARLYEAGNLSEKINTETYFLNSDYSMPIVSITTDPDSLFGNEEGGYVCGSVYYAAGRLNSEDEAMGNYYIKKDIEAHIEMWNPDGSEKVLEDDIKLKLGGAFSKRYSQQKSFNIDLKNEKLSFTSESSGEVYEYSDFSLKGTGGGEVFPSCYQKHFLNNLLEPINIGTKIEEFCVLFINGEYWGIYLLVEPKNEDYFKEHYGISKMDTYESGLEASSESFENEIAALAEWIYKTDFTDDSNYAKLNKIIDLDNYTRFLASTILIGNYDCAIDYDHNLIIWRSREIVKNNFYGDGRLRWVPIDLDSTLFSNGSSAVVLDSMINQEIDKVKGDRLSIILFQKLWERTDFRIALTKQIYRMTDAVFCEKRLNDKFEYHYQLLSKEIDENLSRLNMGINNGAKFLLDFLGFETGVIDNLSRDGWEGEMNTMKCNLLSLENAIKQELRKYGAYELKQLNERISVANNYEYYSLFAEGFGEIADAENGKFVWTVGEVSTFHLVLNSAELDPLGIRMEIQGHPLKVRQEIEIYVNGAYLDTMMMGNERTNIDIPIEYFDESYAEVKLLFKDVKSPIELGSGLDPTLLGCRILSVAFSGLSDKVVHISEDTLIGMADYDSIMYSDKAISATDETGDYIWTVDGHTEWRVMLDEPMEVEVLCSGITATQRVKIFVNDKYIGTEVAGEAFEFHIPESEKGLVKIRFEYPDAVSPQKLGMNEDETMLALRIFSIRFFRSE